MAKVYSLAETAVIISVIYIISLIVSMIYICYHVELKRAKCFVFIVCLIYASLFVFLNLISIFDMILNNEEGFEKLFKFIKNFYKVFTWIDKVFGLQILIFSLGVFDFYVYIRESGYHSKCKRFFDIIIRPFNGLCKSYKKIKPWGKILGLIIVLLLTITLIIFLIIYREHFKIRDTFDYIQIILDCYSVFQIYTSVGFFIVQIFSDCRRKRSKNLINRYYRYSTMKIIERTENVLGKIKNTYIELKNAEPTFNKTNPSSYEKFLINTLKKVKEKMDLYQLDQNINNNTLINYVTSTDNVNVRDKDLFEYTLDTFGVGNE